MASANKVLGPRSSSPTSSTRSASTASNASSRSGRSELAPAAAKGSLGEKKTGRAASPEKLGKEPKDSAKPKKDTASPKVQSRKKKEAAEAFVIPEGSSFAKLGKLKDAGNPKKETALLVKKLMACCTVCDFSTDAGQPEKEGKRMTLLEILDRFPGSEKEKDKKDKDKDKKAKSKDKDKKKPKEDPLTSSVGSSGASGDEGLAEISTEIVEAVVQLVKANAFRDLPARKEKTPMDLLDGEDEEPPLEPTWPHLELVYEILLKVLSCKDLDVQMAQKAGIDKEFLQGLLALFESDDPRERDALKSILTKTFNRVSTLRSSIRRGITSFCMRAIYLDGEDVPCNGLAELLDVLGGRVVGGFSTPLKEEHRDLMLKVVVPLYKLDVLMFYHSQLKDVIRTFCKKEPVLAKSVILALMRYWPHTAGAKQAVFLADIEEMIGLLPNGEFRSIGRQVALRFATSASCPNSEVSEKALAFWRNEKLVRLTVHNCRDQMPEIVSSLYDNITHSWSGNVLNKTMEVLKNFMVADSEIFESSSGRHRKDKDEVEKREELRVKRWQQLEAMHAKKMKTNLGSVAWQQRDTGETSTAGQQGMGKVELKASDSCAVALCWDQGKKQLKRLSLQALVVNCEGKIIEAVHERNITTLRSAVRLTTRVPKSSNGKMCCCGTIWASLDMLPEWVSMLVFLVTTGGGCSIDDVAKDPVLVVDLAGGASIGEINIITPPGSVAGPVAVIQRLESGRWSFSPKREFTQSTAHFMDFPEPILGKLIKDNMPIVPKRQKIATSFQVLDKGGIADFPNQPARTKRAYIGLGWDFSPAAGEETVKVDVTVLLCDADGNHLGTISAGNPEGIKGAIHTGEGALSSGVFLELDSLSEEVSVVLAACHLISIDSTFELMQQPHCTVIDGTGKELARYSMSEEEKAEGKSKSSLIMARIFWNELQKRWNFQGIGEFCDGRSPQDCIAHLTAINKKRPTELQQLIMQDEDSSRNAIGYRPSLKVNQEVVSL